MILKVPKITIILFLLILSVGEVYSCEILSFIGPSSVCLNQSAFYQGNGLKAAGCDVNTFENIEVLSGSAGSAEVIFQNSTNNRAEVKFDQVGTYTLRYTFRDANTCSAETVLCTEDKIVEVFLPEAKFTEDTIFVCKGSRISTEVMFFNSDKATILAPGVSQGIDSDENGVGIYQPNSVVDSTFILRLTNSSLEQCINTNISDSLYVVAIDLPKLTPIDTVCDPTSTFYTARYRITGGDGEYTLLSGEGSISGDIFTVTNLPDKESFTYSINSGPTCGEFSGSASADCECRLNAGAMRSEPVVACAGDIIEVSHDTSALRKRPSDNILYILHSDDRAEYSNPISINTEPKFELPSEEFEDSLLYISAIVGPFTVDNLETAFFEVDDECKRILAGTPVRWFGKSEFTISGKLEVCAGEKNRMYTSSIIGELKGERNNFVWDVSAGSGFVIGGQSKARTFVSFPTATSSGKLIYEVSRVEAGATCVSRDSVEIMVDGTEPAPEESEIIQWPGNILASTSDGPCYQWGFIDKFANFSFQLIGDNSKYYFSDDVIGQSLLQERAYFLAVYDTPDCVFSFNSCNSITFYNQSLLNGLNAGEKDDFSVKINPNPSDGLLKLDISGSFKGIYHLELYSDIGQRVKVLDIEKNYVRSISDLDLRDVPRGVYFLRLNNEVGQSQVMKVVISK